MFESLAAREPGELADQGMSKSGIGARVVRREDQRFLTGQARFADDINLGRGDIILEINKQPVNSEEDFAKVESGLKSGQDVVFLVRPRGSSRQDGTIFVPGTLP